MIAASRPIRPGICRCRSVVKGLAEAATDATTAARPLPLMWARISPFRQFSVKRGVFPMIRSALGCAMALVVVLACGGMPSAQALTAKECSAKYKAAQQAGTLNGMKWNDFRKAECGSTAPQATASPTAASPPRLRRTPLPPQSRLRRRAETLCSRRPSPRNIRVSLGRQSSHAYLSRPVPRQQKQ